MRLPTSASLASFSTVSAPFVRASLTLLCADAGNQSEDSNQIAEHPMLGREKHDVRKLLAGLFGVKLMKRTARTIAIGFSLH